VAALREGLSLGRTSRQRRSAFGTRNPRDSSGSAGRPSTSKAVARAIVPPSEAVRHTHVQKVRSPNRALVPRKSAKKSRSGRPSFAPPSTPGTGNVIESAENTSGFSETIVFVGPRQTEYESTHGTITATSTTQLSSSKKRRKHHPIAVIAASFAKFATGPAPAAWSTAARAPKPTAASRSQSAGARQSGSAR
jgi:hypothetical protein